MQHFIPNNGMQQMQQIYTIPQQQQMVQQMSAAQPQYNSYSAQASYNGYAASAPQTSYTPTPINNPYAPRTSAPPQNVYNHHHHHPQQSISGLPPGFQFNGTTYATSPVDNYSMYNGSVYGNNSSIHTTQAIGTPHAPPPSIASNGATPSTNTGLNMYQQMLAQRNAVKFIHISANLFILELKWMIN